MLDGALLPPNTETALADAARIALANGVVTPQLPSRGGAPDQCNSPFASFLISPFRFSSWIFILIARGERQ